MKSLFVSIIYPILLLSQTGFASEENLSNDAKENLSSWSVVDTTVKTTQKNQGIGYFPIAKLIIGYLQKKSPEVNIITISTHDSTDKLTKHPSTHNVALLGSKSETELRQLPTELLNTASRPTTTAIQEGSTTSTNINTDTTAIKKSSSFENLLIEIDMQEAVMKTQSPSNYPVNKTSHKEQNDINAGSPRTPSSRTRTVSSSSSESSSDRYSVAAAVFAQISMDKIDKLRDSYNAEKNSFENLSQPSSASTSNYGKSNTNDTPKRAVSPENENSAWWNACLNCCRSIKNPDKNHEGTPSIPLKSQEESKKKNNMRTNHEDCIRV